MCAFVDDGLLDSREPVEDDGSSASLYIVDGSLGYRCTDRDWNGEFVERLESCGHVCGWGWRGGNGLRIGDVLVLMKELDLYILVDIALVGGRKAWQRGGSGFDIERQLQLFSPIAIEHHHTIVISITMRPSEILRSGGSAPVGKYGK